MSMTETPQNEAPGRAALYALVTVRWGDSVVATKRLDEGEAIVGAATSTMIPLPCEALGVPAITVAAVRGGAALSFIPRGAVGFRERPRMVPVPVSGPSEIALVAGETVSFAIGGFLVVVSAEERTKAPWSALSSVTSSLSPMRYVAAAALAHALVMGLCAQAAYASNLEDAPADHEELRRFIAAAEESSKAEDKVISDVGAADFGKDVNAHDGDGKDGGGTRAKGVEGSMGSTASRQKSSSRYAVAGRDTDETTQWATREEAIADVRSFGMNGVLAAERSRAPVTAFGNAAAGADPFAATGAMWSMTIGETYGGGGLGLSGVGEGGGGVGEGSIGLGTIGTIGHTWGRSGRGTGGGGSSTFGLSGMSGGWGDPSGYSIGLGMLGTIGTIGHGAPGVYNLHLRRAERKDPSADDGESRLPRDTVQRIVRQSSGRFRGCYQSALSRNPALAGGVTTRFLIGADGRVKSASNLGADLPDSKVIACVTKAFYGLVFPEPPGGRPVTVTYPLTFSPAR